MAAVAVRSSNRRRIWVYAVVGVVAVFLALAGIKAGQIGAMIKSGKSFAPPPEAVTSAKVEAVQWEASRGAVATLVAVRAVTIASEVPGTVRSIGFDSGAFVREDLRGLGSHPAAGTGDHADLGLQPVHTVE